MPSKKRNGKGRGFDGWLENLLDDHPERVVFVLVLLFAFAALEPFLTWGYSSFWREVLGNVRDSLMNILSAGSILLGFYSIHQAVSFRNKDAAQKAAEDRKHEEEHRELVSGQDEIKDLLGGIAVKNGLNTPRSSLGDENEDKKPPTEGDSLSVQDTTT